MKWMPLLFALPLCAGAVHAEIYKHVDEQGHVTYSNIPARGAKKLNLGPMTAGPAPKRGAQATPADFPRIDSTTQRKRDDLRRRVLQEELAAEEGNAGVAREALRRGETLLPGERVNSPLYLDRVQRLRDAVVLHDKNIEALKKELSHVR